MANVSYEELLEFLYLVPMAVMKSDLDGNITIANPKCARIFLSQLKYEGLPNFIDWLCHVDPGLVDVIKTAKQSGVICKNHRVSMSNGEQQLFFAFDISLSARRELLIAFKEITDEVEYERQLERLSKFDELTQLANRRYFLEVSTREVERVRRYGRPLSILIADLDFFKVINDTYGHLAGDEVLKTLGRILESAIREVDTACRFGGEEFCVLLPETDLAGARHIAEQIRATIESTAIEFDGTIIQATLSIGAAEYSVGESLDKLMARADKALYRAKLMGRNRTELDLVVS